MNILHDISFLTTPPQRTMMCVGVSFLCVILLFFAFRRNDKRRLWLRIPLTILGMFCLLMLGLRPYQLVHQKAFKAALLTLDFDRKIVDSLLVQMPDIQLFSQDAVLGFDVPVMQIPDASYLAHNYPKLAEVFVVGNGISPYELSSFDSLKTNMQLNNAPEGITEIAYQKTLRVDEVLSIQGRYQHRSDSAFWLVLEGQSGASDSLKIEDETAYFFELEQKVKKAGRYLFYLVVKDGKGQELVRERFPVFVLPKEKIDLLILNLAPSFESKYLKNNLSDRGHRVAIRSTITRDKFRTEFVNQDAVNLNEISRTVLNNVDVLVTGVGALEKLSNTELDELQRAVKRGMGCIIWGDEAVRKSSLSSAYRRFFLDFSLQKSSDKFLQLTNNQQNTNEYFDLPTADFSFAAQEKTFAEGVATYTQKGEGRVVLLRSNQTYKIWLDGKKERYNALWSKLLTAANRPKLTGDTWAVKAANFAFAGQAIDLVLTTTDEQPIGEIRDPKDEKTTFYLAQHPYNSEQWTGRIWCADAGWHTLRRQANQRDTQALYVHDAQDWRSLRTAQRLAANRTWQAQQLPSSIRPPKLLKNVPYPLPLWWFFVGLLACWGFLWMEEKV